MLTKRNPDYLRQRGYWMRIVVVIVGIQVATIFVTALPHQLAYAQNATATWIPPEIVCKMEPTSSECVQPMPPSLLIRTDPSLSSPSSIPPELECKLNPNGPICLQPSTANKPTRTVTVENNFTASLKIGNKIYPINYQLSGTGNKIISVILEKDNSTLLANISSPSNGKLTIQLPRSIIDSKKQGTNLDESYVVLVDGKYAGFDQIKNNTQVRTLAIDLGGGSTNIEILGTHAVPEFGTAASTALLSIAIVGIVIMTRAKFIPKIRLIQK